jgi:predicted enzyme related to lactoylglutathione lyase
LIYDAVAYPAAFGNLGVPPRWQIYLLISDCHAAVTIAKNLGAKLRMPPMNIQKIGRMALIAYRQGAAFIVFATARC